jgi:hypothetical protein
MNRNLSKIPSDYQGLLRKVKETLVEGQQRIEAERVAADIFLNNLLLENGHARRMN